MEAPRPQRGNPCVRRRGQVARAVLLGLLKDSPKSMHEVTATLAVSRTGVFYHLGRLRDEQRIGGYTSAGGVVRVWR